MGASKIVGFPRKRLATKQNWKCFLADLIFNELTPYAANRKVAGSKPDEMSFLTIYLNLPTALLSDVYSASNKNEYQKLKILLSSMT
jgi:hypothetical protein